MIMEVLTTAAIVVSMNVATANVTANITTTNYTPPVIQQEYMPTEKPIYNSGKIPDSVMNNLTRGRGY